MICLQLDNSHAAIWHEHEQMHEYLYNVVVVCIVFHLFELFTYLNKTFVAFDQRSSNNRGFTVHVTYTVQVDICKGCTEARGQENGGTTHNF